MCHGTVCHHGHVLELFGSTRGGKKKYWEDLGGIFFFFRLKIQIWPPGVFLEEAAETGRQQGNGEAVSHWGQASSPDNAHGLFDQFLSA